MFRDVETQKHFDDITEILHNALKRIINEEKKEQEKGENE
jgi:hypothetical protein